MRLATLDASAQPGKRDGILVVVSPDGGHFAPAPVKTLQEALENWAAVAPSLAGVGDFSQPLDPARLAAPLPRAWQWLDGSAFACHGELMDKVLGVVPEKSDRPLMYQGVSNHFYGPHEDVRFPGEEFGIDFEGEFGVITDAVPLGIAPAEALDHVRLVVSAEAPPQELYVAKRGVEVFEFERTASRLIEMQSRDWLEDWAERRKEEAAPEASRAQA